MRGFVNSFCGADFADVHGWAMHLREQFPERQDAINAALHLPMVEGNRQKAVRRIVEAQIDSLLSGADLVPCETTASRGDTLAREAERALARVGDAAMERYARRLGVSAETARQQLLAKFVRGNDGDS